MSKTIQVRVEDELKASADELFSSLGLDTSTAVRMFLVASMEAGGIPFPVQQRRREDTAILNGIALRKAGGDFLTAEQSLANIRRAKQSGKK